MDGDEGHHVAGETLTRTYNVTNEGTTTLSNICVIDEKFGKDCLACVVSDNGKLPPGDFFVCTFASLVRISCPEKCFYSLLVNIILLDARLWHPWYWPN